MRTFNHVGIVTTESKEGAVYNEGLSVWLTDRVLEIRERQLLTGVGTDQWPYRLYGSLFEKELEGKKVIFGPAVCDEHLTIAFIEEEGIAIEIMELK